MMAKKKRTQGDTDEQGRVWIEPGYNKQVDKTNNITGHVTDDEVSSRAPEMPKRTRYPLVRPEPKQEVLPPIRQVPSTPVEVIMPGNVRQVETYDSSPITRAQAMVIKIKLICVFLGVLTAMLMTYFQLYPQDWVMLGIVVLWAGFVALEVLALFIVLSIFDYLETPASRNRKQWNDMYKIADREHRNRMRAMYGKDYEK